MLEKIVERKKGGLREIKWGLNKGGYRGDKPR